MEIFAAGNKYKLLEGQTPTLVNGFYFVYAQRWVKSKQKYSGKYQTFNIGQYYEEIK